MAKRKIIIPILIDEDVSFSTDRRGVRNCSVTAISEKILPDDECFALSTFLEDENISVDVVNTEYMGYLTLSLRDKTTSILELITVLNKFFKN